MLYWNNIILVIFLIINAVDAFSFTGLSRTSIISTRRSNLYMGRAAAVRAATKARTDGAKAKNNNRYAKKIIMVVSQQRATPFSFNFNT